MVSHHSLVLLVSLCVSLVSAAFNISAKTNNVVYYGQGPNQLDLIHYCQQPSIDTIVLSFVYLFPAQADGYPGTNFGNQCGGVVYPGPGYNGTVDSSKDELQANCPRLVPNMAACQRTYGKKILIALGGDSGGYQLTGASDGVLFANMLWGMFGPRNNIWVKTGLPRPFDNDTIGTAVDGFTLSIEHLSTDNSAGYIALASRLRQLFPASPQTGLLLTGAPECGVPDANMGAMIQAVPFDALFIQFYNSPSCSAAAWASANPNYTAGSRPSNASGFSYHSWASWLQGTKSSGARLFIGLPGSTGAVNQPSQYVNQTNAANLVDAYYCRNSFGGVAIWDATYADGNLYQGQTFYQWIKGVLTAASGNSALQTCPAY